MLIQRYPNNCRIIVIAKTNDDNPSRHIDTCSILLCQNNGSFFFMVRYTGIWEFGVSFISLP